MHDVITMANPGLNPRFVESEGSKWTTSKEPSKILSCILIKHFKSILITGARQTGKTKMTKELFPDKKYVLIDDPFIP